MKFGKTFHQSIRSGPPHWTQSAISYKSLKKLIRLLVNELQDSGLTLSVLTTLLDPNQNTQVQDQDQDQVPVRRWIQLRNGNWVQVSKASYELDVPSQDHHQSSIALIRLTLKDNSTQLIIPLEHDGQFFAQLCQALNLVERFCASEHEILTQELDHLCQILTNTLASPNTPSGKRTLYHWRELIGLWIELSIFTDSTESGKGHTRLAIEAEARMKVLESRLINLNSVAHSHLFLNLNRRLIDLNRFGEINSEAVRKLLKKHYKRTALPLTIKLNGPNVSELTRSLAIRLGERLVDVVPILESYECPVCRELAYKPVVMQCGHRFCVRCLVKLQRAGEDRCPVCRRPVVLHTTPRDLERDMKRFMELWFPKEVRKKVKVDGQEVAVEELEALGMPVISPGCLIS
ncbi:hypothetical protein CROQUDRAFT_657564 [Cronartium quercuum f. sp. fusiforme G11]|uniref:RING-type domain-containing protein n=1 Tax=Cronartium quercuum f. sp. fusiforme G11 TaxID=708437 RepID=A0A9P6NMJ6_9BASI|nr:hypothetical protein CROQUDRAFT_657564 [Cronartium quercuum f. sp. fusiforme G11]